MAQNIGTLVTAAIRPNDSNDPIASAFASEVKGGLHLATSIIDRDNIIDERRDWGMMCYVTNEDKTYQLRYNYVSTDINNNNNWVEFSGSAGGSSEWIDSVLSIEFQPPATYSIGDRYLAGTSQNDSLLGDWSSFNPGVVLEWNSVSWETTTPTDGMSVRVDDEDNAIYRYEGSFPTGEWDKEKLGQIRSIDATSSDAETYIAETSPKFDNYVRDMMFLTKFDTVNAGATASININSMGFVDIKKPSSSGLIDLVSGDIIPDITYSLVYNGSVFELIKHYTGDNALNIRYYIQTDEHVVVPPYHQYWVYGNLTIDGEMTNYGQVVIANGNLINSNNFYNYGDLYFIQFDSGTGPAGSPLSVSDYDTGETFTNISSIKFRGGSVTTPTGDSDSVRVTGDVPNEVIVWIPAPNYEDGINIPNESFSNRYISYPTSEGDPYYAGSMAGAVDRVTRDNELVYNIPSFGYFNDNANFEIEFIDWDETTLLDSLYFTMSDVSVGLTTSSLNVIEFNLTDKSNDSDRRKATAKVTFNLNNILNGTPRAGGKARVRISFTDSGGDNNDGIRIEDFFYDPDGSQSEDANFGISSDLTISENTASIKWLSGIAYYDTNSSFDFSVDDIDDLNDRSYPTNRQINITTTNFAMSNVLDASQGDFGGWSQSYNIQNLTYDGVLSINVSSQYKPGINNTTNILNGSGSYPYATSTLYDWVLEDTKLSDPYPALIDTWNGIADFTQHPIIDETRRETLSGTPVNITSNSSFISTVALPSDSLQMMFGRIIFPQHDLSSFYPQINITNGRDYSLSTGVSKTFNMINNSTSLSTTNITLSGYRWFATSFTRDSGLTQDIAQGIIEFDSNITESDIHYNATLGSSNATPNTVILVGIDSTGNNTTADIFYWVSNNPTTYNGRTGGTLPSSINWQKGANSVVVRRIWVVVGFTDTSFGKSKWVKNITADSFS